MKYLLLICEDETRFGAMSEEENGELMEAYGRFHQELEATGKIVSAQRLQLSTAATTVRVRDGETLITDGPFAETKEQLGGFYLIEAEDLDEAIAWAAKIPSATDGSIEVRPVWE